MMPVMRTTLTIDDDLMPLIEDLRRREGLSFIGEFSNRRCP